MADFSTENTTAQPESSPESSAKATVTRRAENLSELERILDPGLNLAIAYCPDGFYQLSEMALPTNRIRHLKQIRNNTDIRLNEADGSITLTDLTRGTVVETKIDPYDVLIIYAGTPRTQSLLSMIRPGGFLGDYKH